LPIYPSLSGRWGEIPLGYLHKEEHVVRRGDPQRVAPALYDDPCKARVGCAQPRKPH
jgi:hypothetical protein